jgi:hypothetical protein
MLAMKSIRLQHRLAVGDEGRSIAENASDQRRPEPLLTLTEPNGSDVRSGCERRWQEFRIRVSGTLPSR